MRRVRSLQMRFGGIDSTARGRKTPFFLRRRISPVVEAESINMNIAFRASRYGRGGDDYINCPLSHDDYYNFVTEVMNAEKALLHEFERAIIF